MLLQQNKAELRLPRSPQLCSASSAEPPSPSALQKKQSLMLRPAWSWGRGCRLRQRSIKALKGSLKALKGSLKALKGSLKALKGTLKVPSVGRGCRPSVV
jgi:hypothetical protein